MPASELEEWAAYCELEPLPDPYWIGAQICAVTANVQRAKGPAAKIEDFIPRMRPRGRRQTAQEMYEGFRAATAKRKG